MEVANATPTAAAPPTPGGFWKRVVAYFIDSVLLYALMNTIGLALSFTFISLFKVVAMFSNSVFVVAVISFLMVGISYGLYFALVFCYAGYFISKKGATPGKLVMGLRIVNSETGELLPFAHAGFRGSVGYIVSFAFLCFGYLLVAFRADKKGLHDLLFSTQVWKQPKESK